MFKQWVVVGWLCGMVCAAPATGMDKIPSLGTQDGKLLESFIQDVTCKEENDIKKSEEEEKELEKFINEEQYTDDSNSGSTITSDNQYSHQEEQPNICSLCKVNHLLFNKCIQEKNSLVEKNKQLQERNDLLQKDLEALGTRKGELLQQLTTESENHTKVCTSLKEQLKQKEDDIKKLNELSETTQRKLFSVKDDLTTAQEDVQRLSGARGNNFSAVAVGEGVVIGACFLTIAAFADELWGGQVVKTLWRKLVARTTGQKGRETGKRTQEA